MLGNLYQLQSIHLPFWKTKMAVYTYGLYALMEEREIGKSDKVSLKTVYQKVILNGVKYYKPAFT